MFECIFDFYNLIDSESIFWFCALTGSGMFLIQFVLSLFGMMDHNELDAMDVADALKFKWMTKQALTGFLMMFGWMAITCQNQFGLTQTLSIAIAFAAGLLAVIVSGFVFHAAKKLHSPGCVFRMEDIVGKEALVYQRIPANGVGKITITQNNLTHEVDAISSNREAISSFSRVQVINKLDGQTVVVAVF